MEQGRQPERRQLVMDAVALLTVEANLGFPVMSKREARKIGKMAAVAGWAAQDRVRICMEQGYAKSMPRKERLAGDEEE